MHGRFVDRGGSMQGHGKKRSGQGAAVPRGTSPPSRIRGPLRARGNDAMLADAEEPTGAMEGGTASAEMQGERGGAEGGMPSGSMSGGMGGGMTGGGRSAGDMGGGTRGETGGGMTGNGSRGHDDDDALVPVLVEMRASGARAAGGSLQAAAAFSSAGFTVDDSFDVIPMKPAQDAGASARGERAEETVSALLRVSDVPVVVVPYVADAAVAPDPLDDLVLETDGAPVK